MYVSARRRHGMAGSAMSDKRTMWFGAGPARWPEEVLEEAARGLLPDGSSGLSILELSHRGADYGRIHASARERLVRLLAVPETHEVLLLPGGATGQFAMIPANLRTPGQSADYVLTGSWSKKAAAHARATGPVRIAASGEESGFRTVPPAAGWELDEAAAFVHVTTNNTIFGTRLPEIPEGLRAPLVADASSDILTRPLPVERFGLLYAGCQKCIGPAGIAVVIVRKELLERAGDDVPSFWRYRDHASAGSLLNTPPTALVWLADLMLAWIEREGGVEEMTRRADRRAAAVYEVLDAFPDVFETVAEPAGRSMTNITFRLRVEGGEQALKTLAAESGMEGLGGHRSVGGLRISMYTAMPVDGAERIGGLLREYAGGLGRAGA
jgi:phosphoserine aminotransferase